MQSRERQMAENEVRFRALNERLRTNSAVWDGREGVLSLVCECGDADCLQAIRLTPGDYEAVRADEAQFAVISSHVRPDVEDVVAEHEEGWALVRKRGEAAAIAAASDPRSE